MVYRSDTDTDTDTDKIKAMSICKSSNSPKGNKQPTTRDPDVSGIITCLTTPAQTSPGILDRIQSYAATNGIDLNKVEKLSTVQIAHVLLATKELSKYYEENA